MLNTTKLLLLGIFILSVSTLNAQYIIREEAPQSSHGTEEPFVYNEVAPSFPGGEDAMIKFISENLVYPTTAQDEGVEGIVVVQFRVGTDGNIGQITAIRYPSEDLAYEARRVISIMPKWKPELLNGVKVPVYFSLPIDFRLE